MAGQLTPGGESMRASAGIAVSIRSSFLRRAHQAFRQIGKPVAVIMNRAAMPGNAEGDGALRAYCAERGLPLLGELPFDRAAAETYAKGRLIAAASPKWRARFESLRDTVLTFAEGACHA